MLLGTNVVLLRKNVTNKILRLTFHESRHEAIKHVSLFVLIWLVINVLTVDPYLDWPDPVAHNVLALTLGDSDSAGG